jgi:precorrin-2 dehydrogenase/sirohydrochlorin ferrochelatase
MEFYPIYVDIKNRPCKVIGGGNVAERKVETLLSCSANVTVVSPASTALIQKWAVEGKITLLSRPYQDGDLDDTFLTVSATDDMAVNEAVAAEANRRQILLNVVDIPHLCNFIVPAVVERGPLVIAVSTGGASPAMAKKISQDLEAAFGPEYAIFLRMLGAMREKVKTHFATQAERQKYWEMMIESDILTLIADGRIDEAEEKMHRAVGCTGTES